MVEVGAAAFADLGPYHSILSEWFAQPGIEAWVGDLGAQPAGFAMLGYFNADGTTGAARDADLLALAVDAPMRGRGVGRALLAAVIEEVARCSLVTGAGRLRLCVAESNQLARAMYRRAGFVDTDADVGAYLSRERAVRMVRPIGRRPDRIR